MYQSHTPRSAICKNSFGHDHLPAEPVQRPYIRKEEISIKTSKNYQLGSGKVGRSFGWRYYQDMAEAWALMQEQAASGWNQSGRLLVASTSE
jgi:hypothetical protein